MSGLGANVGNSIVNRVPVQNVNKANSDKQGGEKSNNSRQAVVADKGNPNAPAAPRSATVAAAVSISGTVSAAPSAGATTTSGRSAPAQSQGQMPAVTAMAMASSGVFFAQVSSMAATAFGKKASDVTGDKESGGEVSGLETESEMQPDALQEADAAANSADGMSASTQMSGPAT